MECCLKIQTIQQIETNEQIDNEKIAEIEPSNIDDDAIKIHHKSQAQYDALQRYERMKAHAHATLRFQIR